MRENSLRKLHHVAGIEGHRLGREGEGSEAAVDVRHSEPAGRTCVALQWDEVLKRMVHRHRVDYKRCEICQRLPAGRRGRGGRTRRVHAALVGSALERVRDEFRGWRVRKLGGRMRERRLGGEARVVVVKLGLRLGRVLGLLEHGELLGLRVGLGLHLHVVLTELNVVVHLLLLRLDSGCIVLGRVRRLVHEARQERDRRRGRLGEERCAAE